MDKIKITIIGGGSRQWAIGMLKDLTMQKQVKAHICLYDINEKAALENVEVAKRIFNVNNTDSFTVEAQNDISLALKNSDFVIISIEPGIIECRYGDLSIPESYGILQTVGDTTGPGGIMRARRSIPLFVDFAKAIKAYCPSAWVINYTNPMTLCTAALYEGFSEIKAIGCCHEVFHIENFLTQKCKTWYNLDIDRRDLDIDVSGVNHFTFMPKAMYKDYDLIQRTKEYIKDEASTIFADRSEIAKKRRDNELWFDCDRVVALSFLRDYDVLGAAGDRHLAEFVPFFLTSENDILKLGITRTPYWWRVRKDRIKHTMTFKDEELVAKPNDEEGVDIILALLGKKELHTNINFINKGQVSYLPTSHIVESMADISYDSIKPINALNLPKKVETFIQNVASVQEKTLKAVLNNDTDLLFDAFSQDPLMRLSKTTSKILFDKMLIESSLRY